MPVSTPKPGTAVISALSIWEAKAGLACLAASPMRCANSSMVPRGSGFWYRFGNLIRGRVRPIDSRREGQCGWNLLGQRRIRGEDQTD